MPQKTADVVGKIADIKQVTIEGNTFYYLLLEGKAKVYVAPLNTSSQLPFLKAGDSVKLTYIDSDVENLPVQVSALEVK